MKTTIENGKIKSSKILKYKVFLFAKQRRLSTIPSYFFIKHMAQIIRNNFTFTILDEIQVQYGALVDLILWSESIDNNEKQYWFDILPSMTHEQIDRLFNILTTERNQLEELNMKYQNEIKTLNEKHLIEWQSLQSQKAKEKIQQAEKSDTSKSDAMDTLGLLNI